VLPFRKWVIVIQQLQYKKSSDKLHHYSGIDRRILSPPTTEKQDKMPINTIEAAEREQRITALSPSGSGVPYSGWIVFAPAGMKRVSLQNPAKRDRRVRCSCGRGSARARGGSGTADIAYGSCPCHPLRSTIKAPMRGRSRSGLKTTIFTKPRQSGKTGKFSGKTKKRPQN